MGKINQNKLSSMGVTPSNTADSIKKDTNTAAPKPTRVEVRRDLLQQAKNVIDCLDKWGLKELAQEVFELVRSAIRTKYTISFVGEFNQGKSTLINKLLGAEILPTDLLPTTAMLTRVCYGEKEGIAISNSENEVLNELPLAMESWKNLVAFDSNAQPIVMPEGKNAPSLITLSIKNEWLRKVGVDLLDTPGANDGNDAHNREISRALMLTDAAVLCIDAQKGLTMTQRAFIVDRLYSTKVPFMAIALTHLDMVELGSRDRVIALLKANLKELKVEMPIIVTNDVELPSDNFKEILGLDKLRSLIAHWTANPERAKLIEAWLATNICNVLNTAKEGLQSQKELFEVKGEERRIRIVQKKAQVAELDKQWKDLRDEMEKRCNDCYASFCKTRKNKEDEIIERFKNFICNQPNPKKWHENNYSFMLGEHIKAAIITLDREVTERAMNDYQWLNRELTRTFKIALERNPDVWREIKNGSGYASQAAPELVDVDKVREKGTYVTAGVTIASCLLIGCLTAGTTLVGASIIGSLGVGTIMRSRQTKQLTGTIEEDRNLLYEYVKSDIPNVLAEATVDAANRIRIVYSDIVSGAYEAESNWMKTQYKLIDDSSLPSQDAQDKALAEVDAKIEKVNKLNEAILNIIN